MSPLFYGCFASLFNPSLHKRVDIYSGNRAGWAGDRTVSTALTNKQKGVMVRRKGEKSTLGIDTGQEGAAIAGG